MQVRSKGWVPGLRLQRSMHVRGPEKQKKQGCGYPSTALNLLPSRALSGRDPRQLSGLLLAMRPISWESSSCSSFIFIYSLTAGSLALSICGVTSISPSKSHSPVSSLLPYISAITFPIQISPLLSPKAPEPSTQPLLFICFSQGDCLQLSCIETPPILLVEDTLLKANALHFHIVLGTCGSMNLGLEKRWGFKPRGSPGHLLVQHDEIITTSKHI